MKLKLLTAAMILGAMAGCDDANKVISEKDRQLDVYRNDGVEQIIDNDPKDALTNRALVGTKSMIETIVWINRDIAFVSYLPITADSITTKHHLDSATKIYNNLKRISK